MKHFFTFPAVLFSFVLLSGCSAVNEIDNESVESSTVQKLTIEDYMVKGDPFAPVTLYEFSDYQCPFCKKFTTESLPLLMEEYVNTGKVKFVFKDFPLEIHKEAKAGAIAARCAGEQGKYFEYHDVLFENSREISDENLILWAEEMGLDADAFSTCLDDPAQIAKVENDIEEAKLFGTKGTPTFLINDKLIRGAQPYTAFRQVIESELNNVVELELSDEAVCSSDADCKEARTFPAYCSQTNPNEVCTTTSTPTCKLPGTVESECVNIITEECNACDEGVLCLEGECKE